MSIIIRSPCCITSRLLPGIRIDDVEISIEYAGRGDNSRTRFRYYIDQGTRTYTSCDLQSGIQGGELQQGLAALLDFLSAAASAYAYKQRTPDSDPENLSLFEDWVNAWASQHVDELAIAAEELEETKHLIREA